MATLCTAFRIYNTSNDQSKKNRKANLQAAVTRVNKDKHWRQHSREPVEMRTHNFAMTPQTTDTECVKQLREQVQLYRTATMKMKTLALWNLRSTKSALKDVQEMIDVIEDLYGETAFETNDEYPEPK